MRIRTGCLTLLVLSIGCSDETRDSDSPGVPEAGVVDQGMVLDAEPLDLGMADTGGAADTGASSDAGPQPCSTVCTVTPPAAAIPRSDLVLWLRADEGANASFPENEVCVWCDLSGRGHDMPAEGTPLLSTGVGGAPTVVTGAGAQFRRDDLLTVSSTAGRTFIAVFRLRDVTARTQPVTQGVTGSPGTFLLIDANTFNTAGQRYGAYVTNNAYDSTTVTSTVARVHVYRIESMEPGPAVLSQLEYFIDGETQTLARTPGGLGNGSVEDFAGANFSRVGASSAIYELSEVLVYSRPIDEAERAEIETYLQARYGL